jgi:hypothetical protein
MTAPTPLVAPNGSDHTAVLHRANNLQVAWLVTSFTAPAAPLIAEAVPAAASYAISNPISTVVAAKEVVDFGAGLAAPPGAMDLDPSSYSDNLGNAVKTGLSQADDVAPVADDLVRSGDDVVRPVDEAVEGATQAINTLGSIKPSYVRLDRAGFYIRGNYKISEGTLDLTIQSLAAMDSKTSLFELVKIIEKEAIGAGAKKIVIGGVDIVNKKLINPDLAKRLGYSFKQTSENSISLSKNL